MPPNLANILQTPTALPLIDVGNNSDVYKYTDKNALVASNLAVMLKNVCNPHIPGWPINKEATMTQTPESDCITTKMNLLPTKSVPM